MSKILITATNAMIYQFLIPHIEELLKHGHAVDIASTNLKEFDKLLKSGLDGLGVRVQYVRLGRSPFRLANCKGIKDLDQIISKGDYDLIWTNEPVMGVATRIAAVKARRAGTRVIYMVHGFHFYKGAPVKNWLLYYPVERVMAHFTDAVITINKEDYDRARKFAVKDVYYVHGVGLDTDKFKDTCVDRPLKRRALGIPEDAVLLLSVGELEKRKNHEVVLKALGKIQDENIHYMICGKGRLEKYLKRLCINLHIQNRVHFPGYRKDIAELCKMADIYIFPSQREGMGIAALEGMAAGLPLISSYTNGIKDYTRAGRTGFTLKPHDVEGFAEAIIKMAGDRRLREKCGFYNQHVVKAFDIKNTKREVYEILSEQKSY